MLRCKQACTSQTLSLLPCTLEATMKALGMQLGWWKAYLACAEHETSHQILKSKPQLPVFPPNFIPEREESPPSPSQHAFRGPALPGDPESQLPLGYSYIFPWSPHSHHLMLRITQSELGTKMLLKPANL